MQSVTLVEIDLAVVDIARKYLQSVHQAARSTIRALTLRIEDGFAFVRNATETFDLIVLDLTDPGGPSTALYTPDFYRACAARLDAGRRDDAARREPGRASRAHPRRASRRCARRSRSSRLT